MTRIGWDGELNRWGGLGRRGGFSKLGGLGRWGGVCRVGGVYWVAVVGWEGSVGWLGGGVEMKRIMLKYETKILEKRDTERGGKEREKRLEGFIHELEEREKMRI